MVSSGLKRIVTTKAFFRVLDLMSFPHPKPGQVDCQIAKSFSTLETKKEAHAKENPTTDYTAA
jgi:hypothetical protein